MYNEGVPEFFVDQGLYYPTANDYGYYCTGLELPGKWEDPNRIISMDGPDNQHVGAQTESLPYVYYSPGYGYAQSPYNPYNPYIPGAVIGVDGPALEGQQYYSIPPYQNSSPGYLPFFVQPNVISNNSYDPLLETGMPISNKSDGRNLKHHPASGSVPFPKNPPKTALDQTNSSMKWVEVSEGGIGPARQQVVHRSSSSGLGSSHLLQERMKSGSTEALDSSSKRKPVANHGPMKVSLPTSSAMSAIEFNTQGGSAVDKTHSKIHSGRALNEVIGSPDALGDQNRGPRTSRSNTQLIVKAYTSKAGDCDAQGNIIIHTDQYNKEDFPVDYTNAKFFVIKSYSEDDVHKSIKYNVWSSTTHGNKKLQTAYEDAQKKAAGNPRGCPIFLFFSVNASGQFCGVAEMMGPVDFQKDMDFWQQDKWSGCFPVKWHFIKDVPNIYLRHIILENNESKPVTHSRDTQEIMDDQGFEMLKIFKNLPLKTSVFDDFMYYENRQKIMLEEKARLIFRSMEKSFYVPAIEPPRKTSYVDLPSDVNVREIKDNGLKKMSETKSFATDQVSPNTYAVDATTENSEQSATKSKDEISSSINFGSLTINARPASVKSATVTPVPGTDPVDTVTVGSMPVKVNRVADSSGFLTVGTIPLNPKAIQFDRAGGSGNSGSKH